MAHSDDANAQNMRMAYVLFSGPLPSNADVLASLATWVPAFQAVEMPEDGPVGAVTGTLGEAFCPIMFIDAPNPLSSDESFIASAWWWQEARDVLETRTGHAIVAHTASDDIGRDYEELARLCAAVAALPGAIAVIWDPADAVWQAELFCAVVRDAGGQMPVDVMVSVKLGRDTEYPASDGSAAWLAMSYGLGALGHMEVEVRGFDAESPEAMITFVQGIARYLAASGAVIEDGDTIGGSAQERILVRHEPSTLAPGTTVHRIYPPQTER